MSKREMAARVLGRAAWGGWRQRSGALRILAYHRIVSAPWDAFPLDEALISATPEAFEAQMRWAARHFQVLSFRDLAECEREGRPWPERALVVTFDDGYRDNYTAAFPILRELKLPAVIFLATGHIGRAEPFWWDVIAYCHKRAAPAAGESAASVRRAIDADLERVKQVPEAERRAYLQELPRRLGVEIPADLAAGMHLTWDEVRTMASAGIEFGSHTVTHPILSQVEGDQLRRELQDSKAAIERETGRPVHAFAYPAGTRSRRDEAARAMVRECGYTYAVAYDQAVEMEPDRFALPRIHVDRDQSLHLFRANLLYPGIMLRS